jgi:hypothetical protein
MAGPMLANAKPFVFKLRDSERGPLPIVAQRPQAPRCLNDGAETRDRMRDVRAVREWLTPNLVPRSAMRPCSSGNGGFGSSIERKFSNRIDGSLGFLNPTTVGGRAYTHSLRCVRIGSAPKRKRSRRQWRERPH